MARIKVLLRGASGSGKTGLLNQLLRECGAAACGLRTARHFEQGRHFGYDLAVLSSGERLAMVRGEPGVPGMRPAPAFFDGQVRPRLLREAERGGILLVDEVGRFERNDALYLKTLKTLWASERAMILVLKKEPLPFNRALWETGGHTLAVDLDTDPRARAALALASALGGEQWAAQPFLCLRWETERFETAASAIPRLAAWQKAHPGEGAVFVRARHPAVRALAGDAGLVPVLGEWPEPFIRTNARAALPRDAGL